MNTYNVKNFNYSFLLFIIDILEYKKIVIKKPLQNVQANNANTDMTNFKFYAHEN